MRPWDSEEIAALMRFYPSGGAPAVAPYLPDRSQPSIRSKARELGISVDENRNGRPTKHVKEEPNPYREELERIEKELSSPTLSTGRFLELARRRSVLSYKANKDTAALLINCD